MKSLLTMVLLCVLVFGIYIFIQAQTDQPPTDQAQSGQVQSDQEEAIQYDRDREWILAKINELRASVNLPALQRARDGESCANEQAKEDAGKSYPHYSFMNGPKCEGVLAQNLLIAPLVPGGSSEQLYLSALMEQWNEGPPPKDCTGQQCNSGHGHYINMTNPSATSLAIGFAKMSDGRVWTNLNFK